MVLNDVYKTTRDVFWQLLLPVASAISLMDLTGGSPRAAFYLILLMSWLICHRGEYSSRKEIVKKEDQEKKSKKMHMGLDRPAEASYTPRDLVRGGLSSTAERPIPDAVNPRG